MIMHRKIEMLSLSALLASSLFQFSGNSNLSNEADQVLQNEISVEDTSNQKPYLKPSNPFSPKN